MFALDFPSGVGLVFKWTIQRLYSNCSIAALVVYLRVFVQLEGAISV